MVNWDGNHFNEFWQSVLCWSYNGPRYCHCCLYGSHHDNGPKCTWQRVCESLTHLTQKISRFSCFYFEVMKFTLQTGRGCQNTHLPQLYDQRHGLTLGMGKMLEVKLKLFFSLCSLSLFCLRAGGGGGLEEDEWERSCWWMRRGCRSELGAGEHSC